MSKFVENLKARNVAQEEKCMGDVYTECEKRGCSRYFAKAFSARAGLSPMKQTLTFLESKAECEELFRQWKIYLEVLVEKRQNHESWNEWKEALHTIDLHPY